MARRMGGLPFSSQVNKYIHLFPGLEYTGTHIRCRICNIGLTCRNASKCRRHIASKFHILSLRNHVPYRQFLYDFIFMLSVCNVPQEVVDNEHFRLFWDKYVPSWKLPSARQLRYNLGHVQGMVKNLVKEELKNNKIWLSVDETTDAQKHRVIHVLARTLKRNGPAVPLLLSSKRIQKSDPETVVKIIEDSLREFCITGGQVTMLITDGAATMLQVGRMLKTYCPALLHITCLIHACHLIAEIIGKKYPMVNNLVACTKKVFVKSPKHIGIFKQLCPELPLPPLPVRTRWGTWLEAVFYYHKYFANVKNVILQFNSDESAAIRESRQLFSNMNVVQQIDEIFTNYSEVTKAISQLENTQLSLRDSLNNINNLQTALENLTDIIGVDVALKFHAILNENPDLQKVRSITENQECTDEIKEYLTFANPTLLDVERSFLKYTRTYSALRRKMSESTIEALLMLQFYASYHGSRTLP